MVFYLKHLRARARIPGVGFIWKSFILIGIGCRVDSLVAVVVIAWSGLKDVVAEECYPSTGSQGTCSAVSEPLSVPLLICASLFQFFNYFGLILSQARKKFGLLEKHKDYVLRAQAFHKKEETLGVGTSILFSYSFVTLFKFMKNWRSYHFVYINEELKIVMSNCNLLVVFNRGWRRRLLLGIQMSSISRWSTHELLMEFTDQS